MGPTWGITTSLRSPGADITPQVHTGPRPSIYLRGGVFNTQSSAKSKLQLWGSVVSPSKAIERHTPHTWGVSRLSARPQVRRTWGITGAGAAPHVGITVMPR